MLQTSYSNAYETQLTADMLGTDLTAQVQTTDGAPSSPCYLVIEPHNPDKREYALFDGTFTANSFVTTALANRYLDGSAAASGITHAAGAIVRFAPVAQHFRNIQNSAVWLDEAQTITGAKTFSAVSDFATANIDAMRAKNGPWFDITHPDYGAVGDGVADDTTAIQAAIDAASTAGGGVVFFPEATYKVTTLAWKEKVSLRGVGWRSSVLSGTTGSDVLKLPDTGGVSVFDVSHLGISGGRRGIAYVVSATADYVSYVMMEQVEISGPAQECVYAEGAIEEWYLDTVRLTGGTYGFRHANVDNSGGNNYIDKSTFKDVLTAGQVENGWRLEAKIGNNLTFIDSIVGTAQKHGMVFDGGWRSVVFINLNTEGNGQSGKNARTTGSVAAGSTVLTVASSTGFAAGDPIVVAGAGSNQADHFTTVASVDSATQITLSAAAPLASGSNTKVTNASYDDVHFASSIAAPAGFTFIGGAIGGEGGSGKLRYAVNNAPAAEMATDGLRSNDNIPVYDPSARVTQNGGAFPLRQPSNPFYLAPNTPPLLPTASAGVESPRTMIPSPPGKNTVLFLTDDAGNGTGTRGNLEGRLFDPNRTRIFYWNEKSWVFERADGMVVFAGDIRLGGTTGPIVRSGSGAPEGVVTAPVGSLFSRTDGGAGTTLYVKESGTGNTGWVAK